MVNIDSHPAGGMMIHKENITLDNFKKHWSIYYNQPLHKFMPLLPTNRDHWFMFD